MGAKVCIGRQSPQAVTVQEYELGLISHNSFFVEFVGFPFDTFGIGTIAGKNELDSLGIGAETHRIQQRGLIFFLGQTADIHHPEGTVRIFVIFGHFLRPCAIVGNDAIGNQG